MMSTDEPDLIRRAQSDPRAFGPLYDRYVGRIYAFLYRRTGDEALAQDVTAAAFEKALRGLPRFRWQGVSFGAWLYRIARHELAQTFRRERTTEPLLDWHVLDEPGAAGRRSPNGREEALHAAFGRLSDADRELLTLRFFEDLSSAATAEVLGCSVNAVYVRVHRALERLRAELAHVERQEAEHA